MQTARLFQTFQKLFVFAVINVEGVGEGMVEAEPGQRR